METVKEILQKNISVSVIVPFYNGISWLIEAVESVLRQTYAAKEIIVINDGSPENVEGFLHLYKEKITYIYKENGGPATARNLGIEKSTGDYIAFLDSDDIWLPSKLAKQIAIMEKANCVWSHTGYQTFSEEDGEATTIKQVSVENFNGMIYPKMLMSNPIATPCVVIKGDFLRNNSRLRFNNKMRYGQDQYLWINIARQHEIVAINEVLAMVRMRGSNAALRARVQLKARATTWNFLNQDKWDYKVSEIPIITKLAFKMASFGVTILCCVEKNIQNAKILEFSSRILYIVPWILFKIDYKRNARN